MTEAIGGTELGDVHQLSLNELPDVPIADLYHILQQSLHEVNRYPDPFSHKLARSIADTYSTSELDVVVGPGSSAILQQVIQWASPHRGDVVYAWPSFDAYPLVVHNAGAVPVEVPLKDYTHDLPRILDSITGDTRAVILCNPNNPTGTTVDTAGMLAFLREIPDHVVVVLDEAYREFAGAHTPDGCELYRDLPNMVVLRSFSKSYGLAGLRIGFALAHRDVARTLRGRLLPFSVSTVAEAAARAALEHRPEVLRHTARVIAERERMTQELRDQSWAVVPSEANFLWLPTGSQSDEFAAEAARNGIMVRSWKDQGVRVTVGDIKSNDVFLQFAERFAEKAGPAEV
ncbi:histidinol-phosphate transaminase [Streptomyces azureus]|uniref:Aminotransferase n=1 Tax=Streptomyces azureus TaxID=146537 RepID=A0A0K8Q0J4_STRAJ|nr:histidinol-phosphate transaminase [Streptomyces azureus]GAP53269.1 SioA [Streptomyces azureus]